MLSGAAAGAAGTVGMGLVPSAVAVAARVVAWVGAVEVARAVAQVAERAAAGLGAGSVAETANGGARAHKWSR